MPDLPQTEQMTVWEHLKELRSVIIWSIGFAIGGMGVSAYFARNLFELLIRPLNNIQGQTELFTFSPPEIIIMYLKISLFGGLIVSSPFWITVLVRFLIPGLTKQEKRMILPAGIAGLGLFVGGILFTYFVVLPVSLTFLLEMNMNFGLQPQWRINYYISFVLALCGIFGIAFELPLVITVLAQIGVASPEFLRQKRAHVIVGLVILAALLTPPDVVTQLLLWIPLWILYEISIFMANWVYPYEH